MARKKSWMMKIIVVGVFALAAFGAYTLYNDNQTQANKIVQKVKNVGWVLTE